MKKTFLPILLTILIASVASADDDKHQSYISYDDGGTIVKSGDDGREIEAHRNLPVFPGDEIVTARRGRAEVRLSDGNILGIDRTTALRLRSILDSYEGDSNETVVELRYGKIAIHRTDIGREHVRLDTDNASYVADREGVYSVETDTRGRDRVTVFDGSVEVRTRQRSTRLRSGESANVICNMEIQGVGTAPRYLDVLRTIPKPLQRRSKLKRKLHLMCTHKHEKFEVTVV